jgi:cyclopropane-fatty-acyl-phospholipid synthase
MDVPDNEGTAPLPVHYQPAETAGGTGSTRSVLGRLVLPALNAGLRRWQEGRLTVCLPDGRRIEAGRPGAEPHATLRVHHERFLRDFALRGDIGAGESYMAGDWTADDLPRFVELVILNQKAVLAESRLTSLLNLPNDLIHLARANTRAGSRRNIRRHYDLSNDFFALFLDGSMTYSAAVFDHPGESLTQAQERKFARFGEGLALGPDDHVLEIGCGWGAFAMFAARTYGCRVTGVTISREQHALARERIAAAGLADRIDVRLCDYRDIEGCYSKIVSIEMLEAVGRARWAAFFETCHERLAAGGQIGIQVITIPDHRFEDYARHCDWIQKYIFPGGLLPSLGEICRAMQARTPLAVQRVEDIGPHYAETLACWRQAFLARLPEVRALGFDERFIRMWDFYLATCEAGFRTRALGDLQLILGRAR